WLGVWFFFFVLNARRDIMFYFFFSSRRRHTRFKCDWSSDVCSSDLVAAGDVDPETPGRARGQVDRHTRVVPLDFWRRRAGRRVVDQHGGAVAGAAGALVGELVLALVVRQQERQR